MANDDNYTKQLEIFKEIIDRCPRFELKGKTMPYTSANGYMFGLLNKQGQLGFRYDKQTQQKYIEAFDTTIFKSYGATMRGYILIPDNMLHDVKKLAEMLNESYDHVMTLEPK